MWHLHYLRHSLLYKCATFSKVEESHTESPVQIHEEYLAQGLETSESKYFSTEYILQNPLVNAEQANYLESIAETLLPLHPVSQPSSVPANLLDRDGDIDIPRKDDRSHFPGTLIIRQVHVSSCEHGHEESTTYRNCIHFQEGSRLAALASDTG